MEIEIITKEDLETFKNEIVEVITSNTQSQTSKKWLRSAEVREELGISPGTLQNMRINGTIPFTRMGSTYFYDWDEIQRILNENTSFRMTELKE